MLGKYKIMAFVFVLLVGSAALHVGMRAHAAQGKYGGTLKLGHTSEPDTLNPFTCTWTTGYNMFTMMFDMVALVDEDLNLKPWLAKSWEISADGLTVTLNLINNATWHDGKPVTSKDVKWSLDRVKELKMGIGYSVAEPVESVEAPDDYTVVVHLGQPQVAWIANMAQGFYILPKHIWEGYSEEEISEIREPLVGNGLFKFVEWSLGAYVKFEVNKDHWSGRAYVDEVLVRYFPEAETMMAALRAGEIDMVPFAYSVPTKTAQTFVGDIKYQIVAMQGTYPRLIQFNVGNPEEYPDQTGNLALKDQRVRWALSNAIDKERLREMIHLGYADIIQVPITPSLGRWFNPNLERAFDLELAKSVLDEAGYIDTDGDGIREASTDISTTTTDGSPIVIPEGTELEFRLQTITRFPEELNSLGMIADWWAEIGVKAHPSIHDSTALFANVAPGADFDVLLWGWGMAFIDPDRPLSIWWTPNSLHGWAQFTGYSNPEYDALYEQQRVELDVDKRQEICWEMQEIMFEDAMEVGIYAVRDVNIFRTDTTAGWIPSFGGLTGKFSQLCWKSVYMLTAPEPEPAEPGVGWEIWASVAVAAIIIAAIGYYAIRRGRRKP